MLFRNLNIIEPIQKALEDEGYSKPTQIQAKSIPYLLDGRDLLGCAQTGTGKTASFAIPILQNIAKEQKSTKGPRTIKAVVLAPTRELAIQIADNFTAYSKYMNLKNLVIFGGVSQNPQTKALKEGVDILIATPGRMIDLYNQKHLNLKNVKYFVLDEADSMLDMGMIHDVKRIIANLPKERQNILFSATMPKEISKLVNTIFNDPIKVEVAPVSSTTEIIDQSMYFVSKKKKGNLLIHLLKNEDIKSVLVFSRTKHGANKITKSLQEVGINAEAIHGNKSQNARQLALSNFKEGKTRVLVATDIAARGIDVDELSHVINFDLPEVAETYVHRIGRTGRAGNSGTAMSFCSMEERDLYRSIEKLIKKSIKVVNDHPYEGSSNDVAEVSEKSNRGGNRNRNSNRNSSSNNKNTNSNNKNSNSRSNSNSKKSNNKPNTSNNKSNSSNNKSTSNKENKIDWRSRRKKPANKSANKSVNN